MLRRKRGADYDLSDSDDGGEARRRMKRRQFAKMHKALFADERISKVAENPRNQAFLRTIEDHGSDDEMDYLLGPSQSQHEGLAPNTQEEAIPDSQPSMAPPAVPGPARQADGGSARPAAVQRRTKEGRKPASLAEVRASLSNLLEDADAAVVPATDPDASDSDEADEEDNRSPGGSSNKENHSPNSQRRARRRRRHGPVVDRLSLKRAGSSSSGSAGAGGGRMAFVASGAGAAGGGFKVPALLRRATTNSLMSTTSSEGGGTAGGFADEGKIKKGAGKRSGINAFARENERRAALAEKEKRREERKFKGAEGRGRVVGGLFGAGKFE